MTARMSRAMAEWSPPGVAEALQAQLDDVAAALGLDRMEAAQGYHGDAVRALKAELPATLASGFGWVDERDGSINGPYETESAAAAAAAATYEAAAYGPMTITPIVRISQQWVLMGAPS